jgi:hypothetical protein
MNTIQRRFVLFLFGCIFVRIIIAILAKQIDPTYLPYMGFIALFPAFGFLFIFLTGSRKTGLEVGGDKIWWNCLRPLHSVLYFLFAYNAFFKNPNSWQFLALDVSIGLISFLLHHYKEGNYYKLL